MTWIVLAVIATLLIGLAPLRRAAFGRRGITFTLPAGVGAAIGLVYGLPWGFEEELAGRLAAGEDPKKSASPDVCPECGARMQPSGGRCLVCRCGYSTCGG